MHCFYLEPSRHKGNRELDAFFNDLVVLSNDVNLILGRIQKTRNIRKVAFIIRKLGLVPRIKIFNKWQKEK